MGIYLNPGSALLKEDMTGIYIDKSMIVSELNRLVNTKDKYVCISRARRFGKTMAANLISAYYGKGEDTSPIFKTLKIANDESFAKYINKFNVINIDVNGFCGTNEKENAVKAINQTVTAELKKSFPNANITDSDVLANAILKVFETTGEQFVIIMDEYDVLVREMVSEKVLQEYLEFLQGLFKSNSVRPAIALAYLTGILPVVRDRVQSKLNNFTEYTMVTAGRFAGLIGFTIDEVKSLCQQYDMSFEECERWYEGYKINGVRIFNSRSVVAAMQNHRFESYWSRTGSFEVISEYINLNLDGTKDDVVKMLGGGKVEVEVSSFLNTLDSFRSKDDVFTYLIHIGYLAYDQDTESCYIPNGEIRGEWIHALKTTPDYKPVMEIITGSKKLLNATLEGDTELIAQTLYNAHTRATNPLTYNDEDSFQSAIGLAYFYATIEYTIIKELPTGKGYADVVLIPFVPLRPAIIIELKNKKSAQSAIDQIKNKDYDEKLHHYRGNMLYVGISYDPDTKKHECVIEKFAY